MEATSTAEISGVIALWHEHRGTKRYGMMRLVGVRSEPTAQGGNGPSCRHAWAKHRQEILRSESLRLTVLSEVRGCAVRGRRLR
jgi:hypothetical protein